MCGRIDVDGEAVNGYVQEDLGVSFGAQTNRDLCPTHTVSTVAYIGNQMRHLDTQWGIKPGWATSHIINAKSETVTLRQTFVKAFAFNRCLVPCSGFYEWLQTKSGKVKLRFHHEYERPLYMAAFWYPGDAPRLVTLTKAAISERQHIHHRFPVFIEPGQARDWLTAAPQDAQAWAEAAEVSGIIFTPVGRG